MITKKEVQEHMLDLLNDNTDVIPIDLTDEVLKKCEEDALSIGVPTEDYLSAILTKYLKELIQNESL